MDEVDELESSCRACLGQVLNRKWRLDGLLGVGGMAAVYASTHRNGARSAIKILHSAIAHDPEARARFLREAYIANKVGHPGAVAVLDDDVDESSRPYIVMELLEGEALDGKVSSAGGLLPVQEVLVIDAELFVDFGVPPEPGRTRSIARVVSPKDARFNVSRALLA